MPAGGQVTLVSKRLNFPYKIRELSSSFALGQDRTMQVKFFQAGDSKASANELPNGTDLLGMYGEDAFLTGDDDTKLVPVSAIVDTSGTWIKVYAKNTDGFPHTIDCYVVLELTDRRGKPIPEGFE